MANPDTARAFFQGFNYRDRTQPTSEIDLGDGKIVILTNFCKVTSRPKRKRNLFQILLGK